MREIKFRGLRTDGKGFIYGMLAYLFDKKENTMIMPNCYFGTKDFGDEDENDNPIMSDEIALGGFVKVIPESVGQFTGLTDKNKTEIYNGDKVSDGGIVYKVVWNQQNAKFCLDPMFAIAKINYNSLLLSMNYQPLGNGYLSRKDLQIVGNIHQD